MDVDARTRLRSTVFRALSLVSGVCALGYEVLYVRRLTTLLGDVLWVHAALLSTFLLGVGLGARLAHRAHRWLAAFEIAVGSYALLLPVIARAFAGQALAATIAANPIATTIATATLTAIPAVCIGFSLPLFSAYLRAERSGIPAFQVVYVLYNLGAVVGVLAVEIVLVRAVGLAGSLRALGVANICIGIAVALSGGLNIRRPAVPRIDFSLPTRGALLLGSVGSAVFQMFFLKSVFLTFAPHRENFAVGLAIILLGIALGAEVARRTSLTFSSAVTLAPAVAAATYLMLPVASSTYVGLMAATNGWGLAARLGGAAVLGLPPMVLFGATLPALLREERAVAEESGHLLWLSGVGNAAGYLLFVAVLYPLLPGAGVLMSVGLLSVAAGWMATGCARSWVPGAAVSAVLLVVLFATWDEGAFQLGVPRGAIGAAVDVQVFRWGGESATLLRSGGDEWVSYNGHPSIYARRGGVVNIAEVVSGVIPGLSAPRLDRAAVLGLGTGLTAGSAARVFDAVDVVEINGAFLDMAPQLASVNLGIARQPTATLHVGDGRAFLAGRDGEYDAIVNSIPAPTYYAASKIYTREFYERVRAALRPDGIFATWLSPGEMTPAGLTTVIATLSSVFQYCDLSILNRGYYMATCGSQPIRRRAPGEVLGDADLVWLLESGLGGLDPAQYLDDVRLSPNILEDPPGATVPRNTDDFPILEFQVVSTRAEEFSDPLMDRSTDFNIEPLLGLEGAPPARVARRAEVYRRLGAALFDTHFRPLLDADPVLASELEALRRRR